MDCRTCQPTLLDLVYGELAPELATVVRAHVNGCESCGAAFKALQQGMEGARHFELLDPPPAMSASILAYAEQHARQRVEAAAAAKVAAKPRGGFVQVMFDFVGRLASGRQFAMATVFVFVVAASVWVIPELRPLPEGQGVTVVSPDPEGEAAPSGGLAPAEPLDLAVDARSRRIRSREELAEIARNNTQPSVAAELAYGAEGDRQDPAAPVPPATVAPQTAAAPMPEPMREELTRLGQSTGQELALKDEHSAEKRSRSAPAPKAAEAKRKLADEPAAFPESDLGQVAQAAPAPAAQPRDDLAMELESASGGSAKGKSSGASASASQAMSSLERARLVRRTEGCATALPSYEQAVQEYSRSSPQSSVLGAALMELAECQWQLGRESSARATLKRASQVAPVAVRARAMLEGDDKAPAKPVAAPAAPAASSPSKE